MNAFCDSLEEAACLLEILRDALNNAEVHENTGPYWVLVDLVITRINEVKLSMDKAEA